MPSRIGVLASALLTTLYASDLPDGPALIRETLRASEARAFESESEIVNKIEVHGSAITVSMTSSAVGKPPNRIRL
jgi:hypothetical protein